MEEGLSNPSLPVSDSSASSICSPTATDSGLDTCSKTTSREDLSDLDQCSSASTAGAAVALAESGSTDAQVNVFLMALHFQLRERHCISSALPDLFAAPLSVQFEGQQAEPAPSASVESIPEVLEDKDSITEQSDSASVHDMDYVNPRGVRFTQSTQRDGRIQLNVARRS